MKGFVLAAGFGKRLHPITESVPKPLLPVGNLPLIGYSLKLLAHHGITDVIVNLHHLGKQVKEALGDGSAYGVSITYSDEEEILGTGGGLKKMREALDEGSFVVINSDVILDLDLQEVLAVHKAHGALATMVLREDPHQEEFGHLEIDAEARIRRILGQGTADGPLRSLMFAGVHVLEPRFLEYIPPDVTTCVVRYAYMKALHNGEPLYAAEMDGYWNDAGTPARYLQANLDAMAQTMKLRHTDPLAGYALEPKRAVPEVVRMGADVDLGIGVDIRAPVLLGDGARVGDHAAIGPFCAIGPRAQIGKEAKVSSAVVLEGARVDSGARVEGMIVGKKATLPVMPAEPAHTEPSRVGP